MIYGSSIRIARESRGLSQSDLSKLIGVTQATLSRFEKGGIEVTPDAVAKIAQVLNYPTSLFERDIRLGGESSLFYRKRICYLTENTVTHYAIPSMFFLFLNKMIFNTPITKPVKKPPR